MCENMKMHTTKKGLPGFSKHFAEFYQTLDNAKGISYLQIQVDSKILFKTITSPRIDPELPDHRCDALSDTPCRLLPFECSVCFTWLNSWLNYRLSI